LSASLATRADWCKAYLLTYFSLRQHSVVAKPAMHTLAHAYISRNTILTCATACAVMPVLGTTTTPMLKPSFHQTHALVAVVVIVVIVVLVLLVLVVCCAWHSCEQKEQ
jgi:uncharacterized membrane protein YdbT with pleckstrin-like domain